MIQRIKVLSSSLFLCFCVFSLSSNLEGGSAAWSNHSGSTWNTNGNWAIVAGTGFPNAAGDVAAFIGAPSPAAGIDLNGAAITIGSLDLDNTASLDIQSTVSGATLTFEGNAIKPLATIFASQALEPSSVTYLLNSSISSVTLASPLEIYGASNSLLEIASNIQGSQILTYSSNVANETQFGILKLSGSNTYTGVTTLHGGELLLQSFTTSPSNPGPSIFGDLLINSFNAAAVAIPTPEYTVLSNGSNVTLLGGSFLLAASVPTAVTTFNSLSIAQLGLFVEAAGSPSAIELLSTTPLTMGSGTLAVAQVSLPAGGTISYAPDTADGEGGPAEIANGNLPSIEIDLQGNDVTVNVMDNTNPIFDMAFVNAIITNGSLSLTGIGNLLFSSVSGTDTTTQITSTAKLIGLGTLGKGRSKATNPTTTTTSPTASIPMTTISGSGLVIIGGTSSDLIDTTGPTQITPTGTLTGLGTLGTGDAMVTNAGFVEPGLQDVIGPLTIDGSFTNTTGTLFIRAASPTSFDQLIVNTGSVVLNGGTLIFKSEQQSKIKAGDSFVVINNTGGAGITGTFCSLSATLPPNLSAKIRYTSHKVIVLIKGPRCHCHRNHHPRCHPRILTPADLKSKFLKKHHCFSIYPSDGKRSPNSIIAALPVFKDSNLIATVFEKHRA